MPSDLRTGVGGSGRRPRTRPAAERAAGDHNPAPGARIAVGAMVGAGGDAKPRAIAADAPADPRPQSRGRPEADETHSIPGCGSGTFVPHSADYGTDGCPAAAAPHPGAVHVWRIGRNPGVPGLLHALVRELAPRPAH